MDVFASFFRVLYLARMRWEGEDKLWWVKEGCLQCSGLLQIMCLLRSNRHGNNMVEVNSAMSLVAFMERNCCTFEDCKASILGLKLFL